jgi:hypothetical protein
MTLRIQFAIAVAVAAIVLPILVVQAQSEGETAAPASEETAPVEEQPESEVAVPQEESAAAEPEQDTAAAQEDVPADVPAAEGAVLSDQEMKVLMIDVVDHCYDFLMELCSPHGDAIIDDLKRRDAVPEWDDPEIRIS